MNRIRRFRKNKDVTKQKINKIKSGTLKLSVIMLNFVFATFAWFTYTMILNPQVDVNVSAWQVDFKDGEDTIDTSLEFAIENFYPGMEDFTKQITIENLGDRAASIDYDIQELRLIGQTYTVKKEVEEGDNPDETLYVSETEDESTNTKVIKLLNNSTKFPFEIVITHSMRIDIKDESNTDQNKGTFEIRFTWPYELIVPEGETATEEALIAKNLLDTKWGHDIANFYEGLGADSTEQGIEITMQAIARQII